MTELHENPLKPGDKGYIPPAPVPLSRKPLYRQTLIGEKFEPPLHGNLRDSQDTVNVYLLDVTPKVAQETLENENYDKQRDVRTNRVKDYAAIMTRGRWLPWSVIEFTVEKTEDGYKRDMNNGQHRYHAVIASGTTQQFVIIEKLVSGEMGKANFYSVADTNLARTSADYIRTHNLAERYGMPEFLVRKMWAATKLLMKDFKLGSTKRINDIDVQLYIDSQSLSVATKTYYETIKNSKISKRLIGAVPMAMGIATIAFSPRAGDVAPISFWDLVAQDEGPSSKSPTRRTHALIRDNRVRQGSASHRTHEITRDYMLLYIAKMWQLWTERTDDATGSRVDSRSKLNIVYTPWGSNWVD